MLVQDTPQMIHLAQYNDDIATKDTPRLEAATLQEKPAALLLWRCSSNPQLKGQKKKLIGTHIIGQVAEQAGAV